MQADSLRYVISQPVRVGSPRWWKSPFPGPCVPGLAPRARP